MSDAHAKTQAIDHAINRCKTVQKIVWGEVQPLSGESDQSLFERRMKRAQDLMPDVPLTWERRTD